MKPQRILALIVAMQLTLALSAFGQGSFKVSSIGVAPADVPAPILNKLEAQGVRITSDQGATVCEIWLNKTLPTTANPNPEADVINGSLTEGGFLGVLHFPSATTDYRSQAIKAGFYTLRFGLIPQDGNHVGVNASRDAFVLSPVSVDKDPDKALSFEDLVKLSQQASGTPHPGFLVGAQVNGATFPSIIKDDAGHWNIQLKGHATSGDLPVAFTVVGKWEG